METNLPAVGPDADTPVRITARMRRYLREYAVLQAQWGGERSTKADPWGGLMYLEIAEDIRKFLSGIECNYCSGTGCQHCKSRKTDRFICDLMRPDGQALIADLSTGATLTISYGTGERAYEYGRDLCDSLNEGKGVIK